MLSRNTSDRAMQTAALVGAFSYAIVAVALSVAGVGFFYIATGAFGAATIATAAIALRQMMRQSAEQAGSDRSGSN